MEFFVKKIEQITKFDNFNSFTVNMEISVEKPERVINQFEHFFINILGFI